MLGRQLLSLKHTKQPLLASNIPSAASSPLSAFMELQRAGPCSGLGFGLRECCGWFDFPPRPLNLSLTAIRLVLLSYNSCVYWNNTFHFLQKCFLCIYNLAVWCNRPSFQPVSAFDIPSSLSLIIPSFWIKVRAVHLLLSLERWETIVRLLTGLISLLLCLKQLGGSRRGEQGTAGQWNSQNAHNIYYWLSSPSYVGAVCGASKQL